MERRKYPISADAYELLEEVGQGVSAAVHRALCMPFNEIVAIKIIDFERENSDLRNISREAQTMLLIDHPNVLNAHCSFLNDHNLWVVMPFMAGGSCLHILKAAYPSGFEEAVIATILREVLKGLEYLHHQGYIHRDVKAGNILIGSRGTIKLGDFGVSACLFDSGDRQRTRNTFVGTPCWMAPEVMEQLHGYDFKADIWSFGITALELAHGHAPFSKYPPMKVLLMTLQNAPPGLDYERDKKFSKSFKQMIAMCLVKDPSKRPSAQKLLKHSFFKRARSSDYIARTVLEGLPTLGDRLKALKIKEADMVAQKKIPYGKKEEISQNEYKRGISGWNFNIEDVKAQASLIQDDEIIPDKDQVGFSSSLVGFDSLQEKQSHYLPSTVSNSSNDDVTDKEDDCAMQTKPTSLPSLDQSVNILKAKCEGSEDEMSVASSTCDHNSLLNGSQPHTSDVKNDLSEKIDLNIVEKHMNGMTTRYRHKREISNGSDASDLVLSSFETKSDKQYCQPQSMGNCNGGVVSQTLEDTISETLSKASKLAASNTDDLDEKSKKPVVQQKGRFKVTSENVELEKVSPSPMLQKSQSMQVSPSPMLQKSQSMQVISQLPAICLPSPSEARSNLFGCSLFPQLHDILQTNILQRGDILKLMKQLSTGDMSANHIADGGSMPTSTNITEKSSLEAAHDREKELLQDITDLQWRLESAQEELQKLKMKNAQV